MLRREILISQELAQVVHGDEHPCEWTREIFMDLTFNTSLIDLLGRSTKLGSGVANHVRNLVVVIFGLPGLKTKLRRRATHGLSLCIIPGLASFLSLRVISVSQELSVSREVLVLEEHLRVAPHGASEIFIDVDKADVLSLFIWHVSCVHIEQRLI